MSFTDLKKDELVRAARFYKVDIDPNATKAAIAMDLLDAGRTPEQWEYDSDSWHNGEAEDTPVTAITNADFSEPEVVEEIEIVPEETVVAEEPVEDMVLVRFIGRNASYLTRYGKFSANRPFALLTREQYDSLDRLKFREATKAEAAEFYG